MYFLAGLLTELIKRGNLVEKLIGMIGGARAKSIHLMSHLRSNAHIIGKYKAQLTVATGLASRFFEVGREIEAHASANNCRQSGTDKAKNRDGDAALMAIDRSRG